MRKGHLYFVLGLIFLGGFMLPKDTTIPVAGAGCNDWNPETFWYEPWGSSGVHKGIDVFASSGTPVIAAIGGFKLYSGEFSKGGKVVLTLGPGLRLHYYSHLKQISKDIGFWLNQGEMIGTVGQTGNAAGKPPHLHYSVVTLLPYPWRITGETQGWKKMFYLNPAEGFSDCGS